MRDLYFCVLPSGLVFLTSAVRNRTHVTDDLDAHGAWQAGFLVAHSRCDLSPARARYGQFYRNFPARINTVLAVSERYDGEVTATTTMNIEIHDAALEARIQRQMQATGAASAEEALLRLLDTQEEQDRWLLENRDVVSVKIRRGIEQLDRGEGIHEDQLDSHLANLRAQRE